MILVCFFSFKFVDLLTAQTNGPIFHHELSCSSGMKIEMIMHIQRNLYLKEISLRWDESNKGISQSRLSKFKQMYSVVFLTLKWWQSSIISFIFLMFLVKKCRRTIHKGFAPHMDMCFFNIKLHSTQWMILYMKFWITNFQTVCLFHIFIHCKIDSLVGLLFGTVIKDSQFNNKKYFFGEFE